MLLSWKNQFQQGESNMAEATLENNEIKQRAVRRLVIAVVLVLIAVGILTYLSYYKPSKVITKPVPENLPPPPPPIVTGPEPEQILPAQSGQALPEPPPLPAETPPAGVVGVPPVGTPPPPIVTSKPPLKPGPGPQKSAALVKQQLLVPAVPAQNIPSQTAAKPVEQAPPVAHKPSAVPSVGYVIQFGVFSNPQNALQLAEKLKQAGVEAQTETRVQLPVFKSKAEAETVLAKMRDKGITATIVVR